MSIRSHGIEVLAHLRHGPHTIRELIEATDLSYQQVYGGRCWLIDTVSNAGITIPAKYGHKAVSDARPFTYRPSFRCGACAAVYADPADTILPAGWGNHYRLAVNVSEALLDALVVFKYATTHLLREAARLEQQVASPILQADADYPTLMGVLGSLQTIGAGVENLRDRVAASLAP